MHIRTLMTVAGLVLSAHALAQTGTAFTYQGELTDGGSPAAGPHDLQFRLFAASSQGAQVGPTLCADNLAVDGAGRFVSELDFGSVFTGQSLFLEIAARRDTGLNCANAAGFVILGPRQRLSAAPYASFALNASTLGGQGPAFFQNAANMSSGLLADARIPSSLPRLNAASNQIFTGPLSFSGAAQFQNASFVAASGAFSGTFSGNGAGLTGLNASNLVGGTVADARLSANVVLRNAANTFSANQTFSGNVGVGAAPNANDLHVAGNADVGGNLDVGTITMNVTTRTLAVPGAAFANGNVIAFGDGDCANVGGVANLGAVGIAPVNLPDGATITRVDFYATDFNIATNMDLYLLRRPFDPAGSGGTMAQVSTTGSSGFHLLTDTSISAPVVDNDAFFYYLRVDFGAQINSFGSGNVRAAKITYTVDRPLP